MWDRGSSLQNKRQMREAARHLHELQRQSISHKLGARKNVSDIVVPIMDLLRRTKSILGSRDAESMAIEFFESFPYQQKELKNELIENINSAKLLCELHDMWRQRMLNQHKNKASKTTMNNPRTRNIHNL